MLRGGTPTVRCHQFKCHHSSRRQVGATAASAELLEGLCLCTGQPQLTQLRDFHASVLHALHDDAQAAHSARGHDGNTCGPRGGEVPGCTLIGVLHDLHFAAVDGDNVANEEVAGAGALRGRNTLEEHLLRTGVEYL